MLDVFVNIIVVLYTLAIIFVLFHSLFDAHLIFHYLRSHRKKSTTIYKQDFTPFVTIQLPVYNELHVVERLLDAVAAIDYPKDKLEIQVLDDSTDETSVVISRKILSLQQQNISIEHIQRCNREGFKAGALKHALSIAKGEFWCRFGCPMAAVLGIFQKFKSKFRITTNGGQCISCGNCSTHCEMGIDVRWYAQRGQNIARASCVGCGICATVCPRGVLKLENGKEEGRINDKPISIGNNNITVHL